MAPAARLHAFALEFIHALETLDMDQIIALRLPKCTHQVYPRSMGYNVPMDNLAYRRAYEHLLPYFGEFTVTIHSIATDTEHNRVVIHASGAAATTIAGPYRNEYIFILHLVSNETETDPEPTLKLKMVEEHVDSFQAKEQNARLAAGVAIARDGNEKEK